MTTSENIMKVLWTTDKEGHIGLVCGETDDRDVLRLSIEESHPMYPFLFTGDFIKVTIERISKPIKP